MPGPTLEGEVLSKCCGTRVMVSGTGPLRMRAPPRSLDCMQAHCGYHDAILPTLEGRRHILPFLLPVPGPSMTYRLDLTIGRPEQHRSR